MLPPVVVVVTNISYDLQAVAELADLRDALIQLARTRLSFRQVLLIMILEFFILILVLILEAMKTMSWCDMLKVGKPPFTKRNRVVLTQRSNICRPHYFPRLTLWRKECKLIPASGS